MTGTDTNPERRPPEPQSITDFDLPLAVHSLVERKTSSGVSIWTTSRVINVTCLISFVLLIGTGFGVAYSVDLANDPWWKRAFLAFGVFIWGVGLLGTLGGMFYRGKLVIDLFAEELRFYRGIRRKARHVLLFDEIRELDRTSWTRAGAGVDDTPWTYDIMVAELKDGRWASLAVDSPDDLFDKLEAAIS